MNKEILTLLCSIKENFPIMREWKIVTDRIPMLIVDDGKMGAAIRALASDRSEIVREYMKISTIKEKLENTNSDFVFYPYEQTKRGRDFLDFLIAQVKAGEFSDLVLNAMLLVITEGMPLECDLDDVFFICLEGDFDSITDVGAVVPPDDQLTVVADQIRHIIKGQHSQEERFFLAAACFVYPYFAGMSCEEGYRNLLSCALELVVRDAENHDTEGLSDEFRKCLDGWCEKSAFINIFPLPNLDYLAEAKMDCALFYDENSVYMSDACFKRISAPLLKIFGSNFLKMSLGKENILYMRSAKTYTSKMKYYDETNTYKRKDMLRFNREKLSSIGDMDFITKCKMKGEYKDAASIRQCWTKKSNVRLR